LLGGLEKFPFLGRIIVLEIRLDGFVLFVKVGHVRDEILYHIHLGEGRVKYYD
jgi:hypothetical protein